MPISDTNLSSGPVALLICPNTSMLAEFHPLLTHHLVGVQIDPVKDYPDAAAVSELVMSRRPRLCFLDVESEPERALTLIHELQILDAAVQTVVLLSGNAPDLILRCLRQGAAEFLTQPFAAEELKPVLLRLSQLSPTMNYGKGGRIICIAPTKGACGASTIAANLAYRRKRLGVDKLLLADLDPLTGTLSFLMKLKSNYSFLDAMSLASSLDGDLWRGVVSSVDGIDVLLAPENPMDTLNEAQDPNVILEFARQLYDLILVDCAGVFGEWGIALAKLSNELLLVTTNELPALQATQRVLAHLDRNRIERTKVRLVVNRYSRDVGLSKDAIATALHMDVYQIIPSDYESVQKALVEGRPINNASAFGKGLVHLANQLAGKKDDAPAESKNRRSGVSITGFFSSIFSKAAT